MPTPKKNPKKKICFVITAQNQYARSLLILKDLAKRPGVELQIVVGGSALLLNYGNVPKLLAEEGLPVTETMQMVIEGGTPLAMGKTAGLAVMEFASAFNRLTPDIVVIRGDRYEMLSAAMAAAYLNIPIAHLEGGDVTGTIDESVRHAITKLAHLHFVTNDDARARIIRMGEPEETVVTTGAPEVEFAASVSKAPATLEKLNAAGVGAHINLDEPFLIVMNHPVTTEYGKNKNNTQALLRAVNDLALQTIWFWPNIDAGTDEVSEAIRAFRELEDPRPKMRFLKYLPPEHFIALLKKAACLAGNSSAGIKEASYLGVPVVNIGSRQEGRLRAKNVLDVPHYDQAAIRDAIRTQVAKGSYPKSDIYYKKGASARVADLLVTSNPSVQKRFVD